MDKQILENVLADLNWQREQNQIEENRRLDEIARLHPDLNALMQARHNMIMGSVRSSFSGASMADAEKQMAEYNRKIRALLLAKGYPENYLSPVCRCPKCEDRGYIYENSIQKPCECLKKAYLEALSQRGETMQEEQTFACFDLNRFPDTPLPNTDVTQREYMALVRKKCLQYAAGIPGGPIKTLLLHGGSGLGKTFLLNCIANQVSQRGIQVLSVTAYDLLMDLKAAYFSRTGEGAQEYFEAPLLVIDDLGMEPLMENITVEQIYHLLNARLNRGLHTAISTNLSRTELKQKYTERVTSRLLDTRSSLAIPFQGKDIRLLR